MTITDQKLDQLTEQVDALTKMLGLVVKAPAIRAHVKEAERVVEIKAAAELAKRFAASSADERLAMLEAMHARKRSAFLADLGVPNLVDLVRDLDDEQRTRVAKYLDPQTRRAIACALSDLEVVKVASASSRARIELGGDPNAHGTAYAVVTIDPAPAYRLELRSTWEERCRDNDPNGEVAAHLAAGRLLVSEASPADAAQMRDDLIGDEVLVLDNAFGLELVDAPTPRSNGPVEIKPSEAEIARELNGGADFSPKLAAYQRDLRDSDEERRANAIAKAIVSALNPKKGAE